MISWFLDKVIFRVLGWFFPHGIQGENDPESWKNQNVDDE